LYTRGILAQLRDRWIDDGDQYPGYFDRWGFRKDVQPTELVGMVDSQGAHRDGWLDGLWLLFDSFEELDPDNWAEALLAWIDLMRINDSTNADNIITDTTVSSVSQAVTTLTVTATHNYRLRVVWASNGTRAPEWSVCYTPNGGTASYFEPKGGVVGYSQCLIGGTFTDEETGTIDSFWIQSQDTLSVEDYNFVAGDGMSVVFLYEDYLVGA